ncbi:hypothetical protein HOH87_04210 [bacterium]|jgi:hypothetical protein|nr:hypothetical protein [bacterium]
MLDLFKHPRNLMLVFIILAMQLFISHSRIGEPFLDGRLHYYFDNAKFLTHALHSNDSTFSAPGKLLGVAEYTYSKSGKVTGVDYYANHPLLSPVLFKWFTMVCGYSDWVPRVFSLIISMGVSVLIFALLVTATKSIYASWFLTLLYALNPVNVVYQDVWKYFHLTELIVLACIYCFAHLKFHKVYRYGLWGFFFLSFHTDWPAYIAAGALLLFIWVKRKVPEYKRLPLELVGIASISIAINGVLLYLLNGLTLSPLLSQAALRISGGMSDLSFWGWLYKQFLFLDFNFGQINIAVFCMFAIYMVGARIFVNNVLALGALVVFSMGFFYVIVFKNLSFIYIYSQAYIAVAYVLLIGAILINLKQKVWFGRHLQLLGVSVIIPVVLLTGFNAYKSMLSIREASVGQAEDINVIRTINRRIVYAENDSSGAVDWWSGPNIKLYSDRIYRKTNRHLGVQNAANLRRLNPKQDVIVVLASRQERKNGLDYFRRRYKIRTMRLYKQSPNFVYYTFSR